jgi:protein-tyrosine phosphatase
MIKVLFVCMGNICRSPMAEGAFRSAVEAAGLMDHFEIDSAGTIGYHAGSPPDNRAQATARENGLNISSQRSRKVRSDDFEGFDYILAMDFENIHDLKNNSRPMHHGKIHLYLSFAPTVQMEEMPDPYYGGDEGFDLCFDAAVKAADGLLEHIKSERGIA